MKEIPVERKYELENIINSLRQIETTNSIDLATIIIEASKTTSLSILDVNFIARAYFMPYNDILEQIRLYDSLYPNIDELKFIKKLCDKYRVDRNQLIKRIKEVRVIDKYEISLENNNIQKNKSIRRN